MTVVDEIDPEVTFYSMGFCTRLSLLKVLATSILLFDF